MCLAQGPQRSDASEAQTRDPSVSSQAFYHWATALPNLVGIFNSSIFRENGPVIYACTDDIWSTANSLDPAQAPHYVRADLGLNCSQRLSVDSTSMSDLGPNCLKRLSIDSTNIAGKTFRRERCSLSDNNY